MQKAKRSETRLAPAASSPGQSNQCRPRIPAAGQCLLLPLEAFTKRCASGNGRCLIRLNIARWHFACKRSTGSVRQIGRASCMKPDLDIAIRLAVMKVLGKIPEFLPKATRISVRDRKPVGG